MISQPIPPLTPATSAPLMPALQVSASLLLILVLIFGLAWLARRYLPVASRSNTLIKIISGIPVGQKTQVLLLEIGEQWILVGVSAEQVNLITTLTRQPDLIPAATVPPRFSEALQQQLQRWHKKP